MSPKKVLIVVLVLFAYSVLWAWRFNDHRFLWLGPVVLTAPRLFRWYEDYLLPPQKRAIVARGVTARGFTVVDEEGNERIVLGWAFTDSGPRIEIRDKEGDTRVKIAVGENGVVSLELLPTKGDSLGASLRVQKGNGDLSVDRVFSKVLDAERTSSKYFRHETVVPWPPEPRSFDDTPDPFFSLNDER